MQHGPRQVGATGRSRILHGSLAAGLGLALAVFLFLRYRGVVPLLRADTARDLIALAMSGAACVAIAVGLLALRPRVPRREPGQTVDAYLDREDVIAAALPIWALCEGGGMIGAVGFALTGAIAPAIVGVASLVALLFYGPGYFAAK
jgi:hypothetical protein